MSLKPRNPNVEGWVRYFSNEKGPGHPMEDVSGRGAYPTYLSTKPVDQVSRAKSTLKRQALKGSGRGKKTSKRRKSRSVKTTRATVKKRKTGGKKAPKIVKRRSKPSRTRVTKNKRSPIF